MHIHHDGRQELSHPIFLIPQEDEQLASTSHETMMDLIFAGVSNILSRLDLGFTQATNAQSVADNIQTLLRTRSCKGCNLTAANLTNTSLRNVNLVDADVTLALFSGSDLSCINPNFGDSNCKRFDNARAAALI